MPDRSRAYDKSPEGQKYRNDYQKEHYTRIVVLAPKEVADEIAADARAEGLTKTQYILKAIAEHKKRTE